MEDTIERIIDNISGSIDNINDTNTTDDEWGSDGQLSALEVFGFLSGMTLS